MAAPNYRKVLDHEDVAVAVEDGAMTPVALSVVTEKATLSLTGLQQGGVAQSLVVNQRRGKIQSAHRGERTIVSGSLTFEMTGIDADELQNFILFRGTYAANVSTLGTGQKIKAINMVITVKEDNWGATAKTVTLTDVYGTLDIAEQENGSVQCTYNFQVLGEVLVTGSGAMQTERT